MNHNVAVRDEQKEPVQAQAAIEVDVAKENAKAWDILVTKNKKTNNYTFKIKQLPPDYHQGRDMENEAREHLNLA